jgi:hypothetical protein
LLKIAIHFQEKNLINIPFKFSQVFITSSEMGLLATVNILTLCLNNGFSFQSHRRHSPALTILFGQNITQSSLDAAGWTVGWFGWGGGNKKGF